MRTQPVRPALVLAVSSLAAFLSFLDVTIVNIAFPLVEVRGAARRSHVHLRRDAGGLGAGVLGRGVR